MSAAPSSPVIKRFFTSAFRRVSVARFDFGHQKSKASSNAILAARPVVPTSSTSSYAGIPEAQKQVSEHKQYVGLLRSISSTIDKRDTAQADTLNCFRASEQRTLKDIAEKEAKIVDAFKKAKAIGKARRTTAIIQSKADSFAPPFTLVTAPGVAKPVVFAAPSIPAKANQPTQVAENTPAFAPTPAPARRQQSEAWWAGSGSPTPAVKAVEAKTVVVTTNAIPAIAIIPPTPMRQHRAQSDVWWASGASSSKGVSAVAEATTSTKVVKPAPKPPTSARRGQPEAWWAGSSVRSTKTTAFRRSPMRLNLA